MNRHILSWLICLFFIFSSFSVFSIVGQIPASDDSIIVDVPVRGTFLKAINDYPYSGPGIYEYDENLEMRVIVSTNYQIENPAIVDLIANGFRPGDNIIISHKSVIYHCGALNPSNPANTPCGERKNDDIYWGGLLGLFSSTSDLKPIEDLHRVPGAIASNRPEFDTPPTKWDGPFQEISDYLLSKNVNWYTGPMETDIPEDFQIRPHTGINVRIPQNAKYLFLSCIDDLYRANLGEIKVNIEKDSDEDGLPDSWEKNGIFIDDDNIVDLDLPGLGARWDHKDIFIEIDYMDSSGSHNHKPWNGAIEDVKRAFANAPVSNPDNTNGIKLHVLIDQAVPHKDKIDWNDFFQIKQIHFGTKQDQDNQNKKNILDAKKLVYHYCLFAHLQKDGTYSGSGELIGNDFMVTLGAFSGSTGDRGEQAATFMHELGHNLGLEHGGGDDQNFKPNYLSIMNYMFTFEFKHVATRPLDYSRIKLDTLDEYNVNEPAGLGVTSIATYETQWYETGYSWFNFTSLSRHLRVVPLQPIDYFPEDGTLTVGGSYNLNTYPQWNYTTGTGELQGFNDWENLVYLFRSSIFSYGYGPNPSIQEDEITYELAEAIRNEAQRFEVDPQPVNHTISHTVQKGDWLEYSVSYIGNPSDDSWHKFRIEVKDVQETKITLSWKIELLNGENISFNETSDFPFGVSDLIIIKSNLDVGDQFYHEQAGTVNIDFVEDYRYAGEERTVIGTISSEATTLWDKSTGVTTEAEWTSPSGIKTKWLLENTSLWGPSPSGLDITIIVGTIIVVLMILIIFLIIRKRKNKETKKLM